MIPVTHPTFTNPFNGFGDCKVSYLSSVSGLVAWTDYIPVRTVTASSSIEGRTEANGYQNVHPVGATGNVAWTDYIPVYEDATKTVPWSTDANGYIPIGMSEDGVLGFMSQAEFQLPLTHTAVPDEAAPGTTATFTRATTATFPDFEGVLRTAPAGCARFVGARFVRNLLTYTEDFSNAVWVNASGNTITTNAVASPIDGAITADKITPPASAAFHSIYTSYALSGASTAYSIYVKNGGYNYAYISPDNGTSGVTINLTTGATSTTGSVTAYAIDAGNGWWRVACISTATTSNLRIYLGSTTAPQSFTGDGTSGIYVFGAQLENITGRADQTTPSEYVSVGVTSAPYYHGSMVDGVKCFPTDLAGNALTTMLGYSAEGARENLCLESQTIATAPWQIGNGIAVTADQYVAPDGTTTMDKLTAIAGNTQHFWYQGLTTTAGAHTYSVYLRYVNNQWARIGIYDGAASYYAAFDILNGVVGSTFGPVTATTIEPMADGVTWRVSLTATIGASALSQVYLSVVNADEPSFGLWNAAGTEAIGAWGAQLELGSFASSYIATTTAAVTRDADVLTYSSAGNIDGTKGWCYAEVTTSGVAGGQNDIVTTSNTGYLLYLSTANKVALYDGTAERQGPAVTRPITSSSKVASTWGGTSSLITRDGQSPTSGGFDGDLSPSAAIYVGNFAGGEHLFGNIGPIYIGQRQLSASEMQAITAA